VHSSATVTSLLDERGTELETSAVPTTAAGLEPLIRRLRTDDELLVAHEVGAQCHFVHDVVTATGTRILAFSPHQLRMIAASRKKTDRRDAYWIAKAIQTGMMPHPVYIPTGEIRELRSLLAMRRSLVAQRKQWLLRARGYLRAGGVQPPRFSRSVARLFSQALARADGLDAHLADNLEICSRQALAAATELRQVESQLRRRARAIDAVQRLETIPAVGDWVALTIYATVGDVSRFPNARSLASYAGLVPSVHQSGEALYLGRITREGAPALRSVLVQAGHVLLFRCNAEMAGPLQKIALRVHTARRRRKIAVVAAARHILRIAYYVLRDGSTYDPQRLHLDHGTEVTTQN
jgi:transposase